MTRLQASNDQLALQLAQLWDQVRAADKARATAEAKLEHHQASQVREQL